MSAKSSFFICGRCGFRNHPRHNPQDQPDQAVDRNARCEQCGETRDHEEAADYDAGR